MLFQTYEFLSSVEHKNIFWKMLTKQLIEDVAFNSTEKENN